MEVFYMVFVAGESLPNVQHATKESAEKEAKRLANMLSKDAIVLESIKRQIPEEINKTIDSFESACEYLNIHHNFACCPIDNKHYKAMMSMFKLITISEAWNKADDFTPNYSNREQYKYYPWFQYNDKTAGFVCAFTTNTATYAAAAIGSRLCFKTSERARQFGEKFIDLWNDFLLFR
jgi:hypothetical protein